MGLLSWLRLLPLLSHPVHARRNRMPIIKGSHSGIVGLSVAAGATALTETAAIAHLDHPNRSFRYLTVNAQDPAPADFLDRAQPATVIAALKQLGSAMIEDADTAAGTSRIPPVYTYWGQFIDHDITAGTDRAANLGHNMLGADIFHDPFDPADPAVVEQNIVNVRLPQLDLDSVYGDGPDDPATFAEGIYEPDRKRLRVGRNMDIAPGLAPPPANDLRRDLPRRPDRSAQVADGRNDENTIIAQLHTAFLRFHNALIAQGDDFATARRRATWMYQWLVVNDYLPTITRDGIVDELLYAADTFFANGAFMPLEFSVAGFRFGHSMVRPAYDFNMNLGRASQDSPNAPFAALFKFTGLKGDLDGYPQLPSRWIIEWARFTDKHSPFTEREPAANGDFFPARFARKIDTNLALPLTLIPGDGGAMPVLDLAKHLAQRNLLRSYLLSIPVAQHVASWFGLTPLTAAELTPADKPNVAQALASPVFRDKTPLWYYILREAEVQTRGESLGELGSRLVAGTLIGLLKADGNSYLHQHFDPASAAAPKLPNGKPIVRIIDLFRFAGVTV
jgi:hypothetical protein